MKLKKALSAVLALVLMVSGMSFTAFADGGTELAVQNTTWEDGENLIVSDDLTINETVTVTGNVTLTIAEGKTLTINGANGSNGSDGTAGIAITSGTLTVNGAGTLNVTGGNGGNGGDGGSGIKGGSVNISGGSVISTGGIGGNGDNGGSGGEGGSGIEECSLTMSGGSVISTGGNGGNGDNAGDGGSGGDGIYYGSVTINNGSVNATNGSAGLPGAGHSGTSYASDGCAFNSPIITMAGGLIYGDGYMALDDNNSFSGGRMNFSVPPFWLASGYECIADTSVAGYTHRVVAIGTAIINNKSETNKDANHGYITVSAETAMENAEITVAAIPNEGYKVDSLTATYDDGNGTQNLTITDGKFIKPGYNVTVNATFSEIQTEKTAGNNFDLDLETDTTDIPASTTVDQYYIKTTGESTVYNHRIGVSWSSEVMNIKVADAKKWHPATLSWEDDTDKDGEATVDGDTNKKTITLTNCSAKAFTCSLTFEADDSVAGKYTSYSVDGTNVNLAAVTNDITKPGQQLHTGDLPSATITATITPTLTGEGSFHGAAATTENTKYGTFTITCNVAGN